jgi:purine-nucleoside phosphorylase
MPQSEPLKKSIEYIRSAEIPDTVDAAVILGSGLGGFTGELEDTVTIPYEEIPGFPKTTVGGHSGTLWYGTIAGKKVIVFSGRFHHYEGNTFDSTLIPVRVSAAMGARLLVISNAAGAINPRFKPGDLMLIDDLIRFGYPVLPAGEIHKSRFSMETLIPFVRDTALGLGIDLRQGTYCYVKGPMYETRSEIIAFGRLGADVVGMSTLPELICAQQTGMSTIGISLITNMSTGISATRLDHSDIQEVAENRKADFGRLVSKLIVTFSDRGK